MRQVLAALLLAAKQVEIFVPDLAEPTGYSP
jgi:hypothetical protein